MFSKDKFWNDVPNLTDKERERFLQYNWLPVKSMSEEASTVEGLVNELSKIRLLGIAMTNFAYTDLIGFVVLILSNGKVITGSSVFFRSLDVLKFEF